MATTVSHQICSVRALRIDGIWAQPAGPLLRFAWAAGNRLGRNDTHSTGADDVSLLVRGVEARLSTWTCDNASCPATPGQTSNFCVSCTRVLCTSCGGPTTEPAPLPAFRCLHCLTDDDYAADASNRAEAKRLVRGRMHILSLSKRKSSRKNERSGLKAYVDFCKKYSLRPFPASPGMVMDFMVYGLQVKNWDSSTIQNRVLAIGSFYQYVRNNLCLRHVKSPLRDPEVIECGRVIGVNLERRRRPSGDFFRRALRVARTRLCRPHATRQVVACVR